jgi:hypothetical protein
MEVEILDYTREFVYGEGDISLPDAPENGFVFNKTPFCRYRDLDHNWYLLTDRNQELFLELLDKIWFAVKNQSQILIPFTLDNMAWYPGVHEYMRQEFGINRMIRQNTRFNYIVDNRFTRTGKISKNAYILNFWDHPYNDSLTLTTDKSHYSFGEFTIDKFHQINKGRVIQWLNNNGKMLSTVTYFKTINNEIVVNGMERNGRNVLNT